MRLCTSGHTPRCSVGVEEILNRRATRSQKCQWTHTRRVVQRAHPVRPHYSTSITSNTIITISSVVGGQVIVLSVTVRTGRLAAAAAAAAAAELHEVGIVKRIGADPMVYVRRMREYVQQQSEKYIEEEALEVSTLRGF